MNKKHTASKSFTKKMMLIVLSALMMITILAGCLGNQEVGEQQNRVLRIATVYGDRNYTDSLRMQYTDIFQYSNSHIQIEFVSAIDYGRNNYGMYDPNQVQPDPVEEMIKLMDGPNPPDVVLLDLNVLPGIIAENLLAPLEPLMQQDNFDISDFVPAVVDGLKDYGNGTLYALAPSFTSQVLMYNVDIFHDLGVPVPTDQMTWDQIFNLAQQVTTGEGADRIAGFSFTPYYYNDLFYNMSAYTAPLDLRMFDDNMENMLVDSQQWEDAWQAMIDLEQSGVFPTEPDYNNMDPGIYNPMMHDAFLSGKLAMVLANNYQVNEIINANNDAELIDGYEYINWDVVTLPVHPTAPDIGGHVYMDPIMGINAKAENSDDAWDFIKFLNGESWAELKSQSSYNMVSRKSYIKPRQGLQYNIEAFYKLKPAPQNTNYNLTGRMSETMYAIENMGQNHFRKASQGEIEVREALMQWQTEGELFLQRVKDNPDTPVWELRNQIQMEGMSFDGMTMEKINVMRAAGELPMDFEFDISTDAVIDVEEEATVDEADGNEE